MVVMSATAIVNVPLETSSASIDPAMPQIPLAFLEKGKVELGEDFCEGAVGEEKGLILGD